MKRIDLNKIRKTKGLRQPLLARRVPAGMTQQTMITSEGPTDTLTGIRSASSANGQGALMRIMLHGIYVGHHFDGGFRGGTGEFYWYSSVADGHDLYVVDSRQAPQFGRNGILTGVDEKTWLDFGLLELFRSEHSPKRRNVVFSLSLMESDNSDEAKAIFANATSIAADVAEHYGGVNVGDLERKVVNTFNSIVEADDDDDAIQAVRGLDYLTHYNVGRFLRLEGKRHDRPTFAICSIVPFVDPGSRDFSFYEEEGLSVNQTTGVKRTIDIPQDGQLSIMMRVRSGSRYGVAINGPNNRNIASYGWTAVKTIKVKRGKYPLHLRSLIWPSRVDLRVMYTSNNLKKRFV